MGCFKPSLSGIPAICRVLWVGWLLFCCRIALGEPSFSVASRFPVGTNPVAIGVADVNFDGRIDLIVANGGEKTISVLTNEGRGRFALASTLQLAHEPLKLLLADVNLDGRPDVIAAHAGNGFSILTNSDPNAFGLASTVTNVFPNGVTVADLNGDGWIELIAADGRYVEVLTNDHHAQFTLAASLYSGFYPYTVVAA